ncbi:DMT family transporter [Bacillus horti]|uniref:Multidrug resistance protein EbrB n=1 Tax=Caldalkalibacillus horti TaxID=77523 RepID=A0ABT9W579_9BACI|nr:multidrug efflux SMR transporter [Bacillus horti]MDQ0168396.1 multidrug resistance protein EbrB [Bacillus horti]
MAGVIYLGIAIIFEAFGTTMLKLSNGFSVLLPTLGVGAGFLISFTFLSFSLKTVPLSTAYATWSGVGTALSAMIGVIIFNESLSMFKAFALILVITGIVILNKSRRVKPNVAMVQE